MSIKCLRVYLFLFRPSTFHDRHFKVIDLEAGEEGVADMANEGVLADQSDSAGKLEIGKEFPKGLVIASTIKADLSEDWSLKDSM